MRSSSFFDIGLNHNIRVESMNQIACLHCLFVVPSAHSPKWITKHRSWLERSIRRGLIRSSSEFPMIYAELPMISAELPMISAELPMISAKRLDSGQGETFSLIIVVAVFWLVPEAFAIARFRAPPMFQWDCDQEHFNFALNFLHFSGQQTR